MHYLIAAPRCGLFTYRGQAYAIYFRRCTVIIASTRVARSIMPTGNYEVCYELRHTTVPSSRIKVSRSSRPGRASGPATIVLAARIQHVIQDRRLRKVKINLHSHNSSLDAYGRLFVFRSDSFHEYSWRRVKRVGQELVEAYVHNIGFLSRVEWLPSITTSQRSDNSFPSFLILVDILGKELLDDDGWFPDFLHIDSRTNCFPPRISPFGTRSWQNIEGQNREGSRITRTRAGYTSFSMFEDGPFPSFSTLQDFFSFFFSSRFCRRTGCKNRERSSVLPFCRAFNGISNKV